MTIVRHPVGRTLSGFYHSRSSHTTGWKVMNAQCDFRLPACKALNDEVEWLTNQ